MRQQDLQIDDVNFMQKHLLVESSVEQGKAESGQISAHIKGITDQIIGSSVSDKSAIPCSIHQTWKTNDISLLGKDRSSSVQSFKELNPDCSHKLWSDVQVDAFIKEEYPELWKIWTSLEPIQRADLFRYAVILRHGGYYADVDVNCLKPIKDWGIAPSTKLVLGYETGWHLSNAELNSSGFPRSEQFEQWLFAAAPGHPVLSNMLDLSLKRYQGEIRETMELTGPALFSDAVHEYLSRVGREIADGNMEPSNKQDKDGHLLLQYPPGWQNPANVQILSADVVAAPGFSTVGENDDMIIRHHFEGTWKPK